MSARKKASALPSTPQIVGTIHSPGSLKRALRLKEGEVDLVELRVDHFADNPDKFHETAAGISMPRIVTVRHPKEGGANGLPLKRRIELYGQFLDLAAFIDIELQSVAALAEVTAAAKERGIPVIVSDHHFRSTPSLVELKRRATAAWKGGADLVKVAASANSAADLARLLTFFTEVSRRQPLSVMGMGRFGKISRLLFAKTGSLLNYGYLHEAQVPGQWEATLLKKRLGELDEER